MFTRQVSEASFQIMESFKGALAKSIEDGTQAATLSMLPTDALRTEAQKWMESHAYLYKKANTAEYQLLVRHKNSWAYLSDWSRDLRKSPRENEFVNNTYDFNRCLKEVYYIGPITGARYEAATVVDKSGAPLEIVLVDDKGAITPLWDATVEVTLVESKPEVEATEKWVAKHAVEGQSTILHQASYKLEQGIAVLSDLHIKKSVTAQTRWRLSFRLMDSSNLVKAPLVLSEPFVVHSKRTGSNPKKDFPLETDSTSQLVWLGDEAVKIMRGDTEKRDRKGGGDYSEYYRTGPLRGFPQVHTVGELNRSDEEHRQALFRVLREKQLTERKWEQTLENARRVFGTPEAKFRLWLKKVVRIGAAATLEGILFNEDNYPTGLFLNNIHYGLAALAPELQAKYNKLLDEAFMDWHSAGHPNWRSIENGMVMDLELNGLDPEKHAQIIGGEETQGPTMKMANAHVAMGMPMMAQLSGQRSQRALGSLVEPQRSVDLADMPPPLPMAQNSTLINAEKDSYNLLKEWQELAANPQYDMTRLPSLSRLPSSEVNHLNISQMPSTELLSQMAQYLNGPLPEIEGLLEDAHKARLQQENNEAQQNKRQRR